jgi:hypothetical protein
MNDPLDALEQHIEDALAGFERGEGNGWDEVESLLTGGYARLLAVETLCIRIDQQLDAGNGNGNGSAAQASRELDELDAFHRTLVADADRMRQQLGRFKSRAVEARRRNAASAA